MGMTFSWLGVGECKLFLARCKWVRVSVAGGWVNVTFFGWIWVSVTFSWLGVGKCGRVWVGVGERTVYN